MNAFVKLPLSEQALYFKQASSKIGLSAEAVEKDFWVVWVLDRLFRSSVLADKIIFKGGTSLSKVFGLIRRFSEDIDLILDWNQVVKEDPNLRALCVFAV